MDELDLRIIGLLQMDGRTSNSDLARELGVSEGTIRRRLWRFQDSFNCMFLASHGKVTHSDHSSLAAYWDWLSQDQGLDPKLLAVCIWEDHNADTSESILDSGDRLLPQILLQSAASSPPTRL